MLFNSFVRLHKRTTNATQTIFNRERAAVILSNMLFNFRSNSSIFTKVRGRANEQTDEPKVVKVEENGKNYSILT